MHSVEEYNPFYKGYRELFGNVVNKSELDKLHDCCCGKCNKPERNLCNENRCWFHQDYLEWRKCLKDGPRIIYVDRVITPEKKRGEYTISASDQCVQIIRSQITKYQKHFNGNNESLSFIKSLIDKKKPNFKRAKIWARRSGFDKIVETVDKFYNGELGTVKSKNK